MLMPAGAGFSMTNVATVTSRVLVVTFAVPHSLADAKVAEALPRDVIGQTLAGGIATDVRVGAASLQMRRITLGSGAQLAFATTEGPILIAVDAGLLDIAASAPAWIRSGADGMNRQRRKTTLAPGDGALLGSGGFATLRNGGADPVFALVLTLQAIPAATPIATST